MPTRSLTASPNKVTMCSPPPPALTSLIVQKHPQSSTGWDDWKQTEGVSGGGGGGACRRSTGRVVVRQGDKLVTPLSRSITASALPSEVVKHWRRYEEIRERKRRLGDQQPLTTSTVGCASSCPRLVIYVCRPQGDAFHTRGCT